MSIRVYLISRIAPAAHERNSIITSALGPEFEVFLPQEHNPFNKAHDTFPQDVFDTDLRAMERADLGLALVPFGRDCSWEVGWFSCSPKPVVAYVDYETEWLRDWMLKGGLDLVVTPNRGMCDHLRRDPILWTKSLYIPSLAWLGNALAAHLKAAKTGSCRSNKLDDWRLPIEGQPAANNVYDMP